MAMGFGNWGLGPLVGFGWVFPLICLAFMVVFLLACTRRMGRVVGGRAIPGGCGRPDVGDEDLRAEIRDLKEEVRKLSTRG